MGLTKTDRSPFFQYRFCVGGKLFRGSTRTSNRRTAQEIEKKLVVQANAALADEMQRRKSGIAPLKTVHEAIDVYLTYKRDVQPLRGQGYAILESYCRWLKRAIDETVEITDVDTALAHSLVVKRARELSKHGQKLAPATINRSASEPLRKVLNHAQRFYRIRFKFPVDWRAVRLPEPQERIRELSYEEEDRLVAAYRDDYRALHFFAIESSTRMSEMVGLRWRDVDWDHATIRLNRKGGRAGEIPLTEPLAMILQGLVGHHPEHVFTYLVKRTRGGRINGERRPITKSGLGTEFRRARQRAGLVDYRFHDNRHTGATRVLRAGGNLKTVQVLLGHSKIETTTKYAHVNQQDVASAMLRASRRMVPKLVVDNRTPREESEMSTLGDVVAIG